MPSLEDASHTFSPKMVDKLHQLWIEARADDSPGLDPDAVFGELESKYLAVADTADKVA